MPHLPESAEQQNEGNGGALAGSAGLRGSRTAQQRTEALLCSDSAHAQSRMSPPPTTPAPPPPFFLVYYEQPDISRFAGNSRLKVRACVRA